MTKILATAALWAATLSAVTFAPPVAIAADPLAERASRDRGDDRLCTATFCTGTPSHPVSTAIGFGAAVLAAGWIGRRSHTPR